MAQQLSPELEAQLLWNAKRIMHGGVRCLRCDKWLALSPDLWASEAREELRDEGWSEQPGGYLCNECCPEEIEQEHIRAERAMDEEYESYTDGAADGWVTCFICDGEGQVGDDETGENLSCDNCGGTGYVWGDSGTDDDVADEYEGHCQQCNAEVHLGQTLCRWCEDARGDWR